MKFLSVSNIQIAYHSYSFCIGELDWPYLKLSTEMKAKILNGFMLCYCLFDGDYQLQTIKLYEQDSVWLDITHSYSYDSDSRNITKIVTLKADNYSDSQELVKNYTRDWNKFCFNYKSVSGEYIFVVNDNLFTNISLPFNKRHVPDLILFKVLGMFSQVTISTVTVGPGEVKESGDVHSWNTSLWKYDKSYEKKITNLDLISSQKIFVPTKLDIYGAQDTCTRLGNGQIPEFLNDTEWLEIYKHYKSNYVNLTFIHFPYRQIDDTVHSLYDYAVNMSDRNKTKLCKFQDSVSYLAFNDTACNSSYWPLAENYFFCNISFFPIFTLYGKENSLGMDQFYYPNFRFKQLSWLGSNGTFIKYDQTKWLGKKINSETTITSNATQESLLIGRSDWVLNNISSSGIMHSCGLLDFVCEDGSCLSSESRCDGLFDCIDESDEVNCSLMIMTMKL